MFECGIWNVNDLYEDGNLIAFNIWQSRGATIADYLTWRSIISAIPVTWKYFLQQNVPILETPDCGKIHFENKKRSIYIITEKEIKHLLKQELSRSTSQMKKQNNLNLDQY